MISLVPFTPITLALFAMLMEKLETAVLGD